MGIEEMETEFFGSSRRSRPSRSERTRAKREQRRRLRPLGSPDPEERGRAAVGLVDEGLDRNATTLVDFVRDEFEPGVRAAVAQAVLAAPVGPDPDHPASNLRDWALAEVMRQRGTAAAAAAAPPAPPPFFAGPAPVAPGTSSSPPSTDHVGAPPAPAAAPEAALALSPEDRWRAGTAGFAPPDRRPVPARRGLGRLERPWRRRPRLRRHVRSSWAERSARRRRGDRWSPPRLPETVPWTRRPRSPRAPRLRRQHPCAPPRPCGRPLLRPPSGRKRPRPPRESPPARPPGGS